MKTSSVPLFASLVLLAATTIVGQAVPQDVPQEIPPANYDEAKVPKFELPDPLVLADGQAVDSARCWIEERRPELLDLFAREMFGRFHDRPMVVKYGDIVSEPVFDGKGVRHQFTIYFGDTDDLPVRVLVYVPKTNDPDKRFSAFLGLNFQGNHTICDDPGIRLGETWDRSKKQRFPAREDGRGVAKRRWPVERLLHRGYALVTAHYCDIEPDFPGGSQHGIRRHDDPNLKPDEGNAIAVWAWGMSRILDSIESLEDRLGIDPKKVAVFGHSRLGKTALWTGATDPRFALVVSNDSGCGGAALSRREFGETVLRINKVFPHWFCGHFKKYGSDVHSLPFDQHELIALIAPRPVYVASATEDLWADPRGEFLAALHADPVYRLLGTDGFGEVKEMPAPETPVGARIGYHLRTGKHDIIEYDWMQFLDFADRHLN